jgi:hypothetical protein
MPKTGVLEILGRAHEARLQIVIVLGFDRDGNFYSDSELKDGGDALWLLEEAKRKVMEAGR